MTRGAEWGSGAGQLSSVPLHAGSPFESFGLRARPSWQALASLVLERGVGMMPVWCDGRCAKGMPHSSENGGHRSRFRIERQFLHSFLSPGSRTASSLCENLCDNFFQSDYALTSKENPICSQRRLKVPKSFRLMHNPQHETSSRMCKFG